jgi:hypothetical protein
MFNKLKLFIPVLIFTILTTALPAANAENPTHAVRTGEYYADLNFDDETLSDWESENPFTFPAEGAGKSLLYTQSASDEGMRLSKTFDTPITGAVAVEMRVKMTDDPPRRDLFTFKDSADNEIKAVSYYDTASPSRRLFRIPNIVGGSAFTIAQGKSNTWHTVTMFIDFTSGANLKPVKYFFDGVLVEKHPLNANLVPAALASRLNDIKTMEVTGVSGSAASTYIDYIKIYPAAVADYEAIAFVSANPANDAAQAAEDVNPVIVFNGAVSDNVLDDTHFYMESGGEPVPLANIAKEGNGVKLTPDGILNFNTNYTVYYTNIYDIHNIPYETVSGSVNFSTRDGYIKISETAFYKDTNKITELEPGTVTGKVKVINYSTRGAEEITLITALYKEINGVTYLWDVSSSDPVTVPVNESAELAAAVTVPNDGGIYSIAMFFVNNTRDIASISDAVYLY